MEMEDQEEKEANQARDINHSLILSVAHICRQVLGTYVTFRNCPDQTLGNWMSYRVIDKGTPSGEHVFPGPLAP